MNDSSQVDKDLLSGRGWRGSGWRDRRLNLSWRPGPGRELRSGQSPTADAGPHSMLPRPFDFSSQGVRGKASKFKRQWADGKGETMRALRLHKVGRAQFTLHRRGIQLRHGIMMGVVK